MTRRPCLSQWSLVRGVHRSLIDSACHRWTWWRHQMEKILALLAFCVDNSPVTSEIITCGMYFSIPKPQWCNRWRLAMNKLFHHTFHRACDYLSAMGFKLIHVSKRWPRNKPLCHGSLLLFLTWQWNVELLLMIWRPFAYTDIKLRCFQEFI